MPSPPRAASLHYEYRIERLSDQLPERFRTTVRWLRRPSLRWVGMVAGVLFIAGSFLSILPIFGLWMLPLGLMLLAEDIAPLRRARDRVLDWIERRSGPRRDRSPLLHPHLWFPVDCVIDGIPRFRTFC
jgi:hypothetical protein